LPASAATARRGEARAAYSGYRDVNFFPIKRYGFGSGSALISLILRMIFVGTIDGLSRSCAEGV
jgi:hypothetical protein